MGGGPLSTAADAVVVDELLTRERGRVERALADVASSGLAGASPALLPALRYALESRGKRLRPILCCTAFRAVGSGEPPDGVYRLASALEWIHTYSLVHDDLPCMDNDDMRRGRPTTHRVFGTRTATFAGAALIPMAAALLDREAAALGLPAEERGALLRTLCVAAGAGGMVGGQLRDLEAEARPLGGAELEAVHRAKTGALLAASLRIGALAARGSAQACDAVTRYGAALGLAFQITDDLLDVMGDPASTGKTRGRDASLGKATYPRLFGVDGARALAHRAVDDARTALCEAGLRSPELHALAGYVAARQG